MKLPLLLLLAGTLTGCSSFPNHQTPFSVRHPLLIGQMKGDDNQDTTYLAERGIAFVAAFKSARAPDRDAASIRHYLDTGLSYSHLLCKQYFDRLTFTKAHRDFTQRETNLAAGLTSALMGLADASTAAVAGVGAVFSFSSASFDAYNETFVVSPDLSLLERLVREKQAQEEVIIYRMLNAPATLRWPDRIESFEQAERALSNYIAHCTVNGIRSLLDESVQTKTDALQANVRNIQGTEERAKPASALVRE